ncbi:hypothetical protein [Sphingomonas parva]|nr:hypothetical protein [Sphingomonas parva]
MGKETDATKLQMTNHAVSLNQSMNSSMTAAIALFDEKHNRYSEYQKNYKEDAVHDHVEARLFEALLKDYGGGANLPNNCVIVLTCNWSPCKQCTTSTIKAFMDTVAGLQREIRVKMRYRMVWCTQNTQGKGGNLYASSSEATDAYRNLCSRYGARVIQKWAEDFDHETSATFKTTRTLQQNYLVIENFLTNKTSTLLNTETDYEMV